MKKFSDIISKLINKLGRFLDKYGIAAFIIFWFVFVMSCFFIWGYIEVHASADLDYFPMHQNKNNNFSDEVLNYIDNNLDSTNNYIFCSFQGISNPNSPNYKSYDYLYIVVPKNADTMLYAEKNNDLIHFSLYKMGNYVPTGGLIKYLPRYERFDNITYSGILNYFQNMTSSEYSTQNDYISNFKLWTNNNPDTRKLVLNYGYLEPDYYAPGSAIAPSLIPPVYPPDVPKPSQVPTFRPWNSYTWNTYNPPSVDTSTLETLVGSLIDIVKYNAQFIADGVGGAINNLGNNLKNLIEDLGNIIKYYGDVISKNLQDFATNIYDNFKELLQPLNDVVQLFVKPWDASEFEQQLGESAFYGSLDSTITNIRSFGTSLTRATEPQDFSFTINLSAIGWGTSEISFNWIKPFRTVIRLIIGCVLVYWLVITVITEINNIIGSGGDSEQ